MRKLVWLVVVGVAACSPSVTSVDGNKNVKSLSPSDGKQLCEDVVTYISDNLSGDELAKVACGFSVTPGASCQSEFDKCVADANITAPIAGTADCSSFEATLKNCDTTVEQYTTCIEQMVDAFGKLAGEVPLCTDQAQMQAFVGLASDISPDCLKVFQTCNVSLGSTMTSSSGSGGSSH
ncbi:MAG TPA: hypothetical protein VHB21_23685 [Minicystis sp.]|nr:hypothetical protein [Minicystis sp.]